MCICGTDTVGGNKRSMQKQQHTQTDHSQSQVAASWPDKSGSVVEESVYLLLRNAIDSIFHIFLFLSFVNNFFVLFSYSCIFEVWACRTVHRCKYVYKRVHYVALCSCGKIEWNWTKKMKCNINVRRCVCCSVRRVTTLECVFSYAFIFSVAPLPFHQCIVMRDAAPILYSDNIWCVYWLYTCVCVCVWMHSIATRWERFTFILLCVGVVVGPHLWLCIMLLVWMCNVYLLCLCS